MRARVPRHSISARPDGFIGKVPPELHCYSCGRRTPACEIRLRAAIAGKYADLSLGGLTEVRRFSL